MSDGEKKALSAIKIKKIKLAVESRCELCKGNFPMYNLTIHFISHPHPHPKTEMIGIKEPENLLVVCTNCRMLIRNITLPESSLRKITENRPERIEKKIRDVLHAENKSYYSTVHYDEEELFNDALSIESLDLFPFGL
jgi:hypothetical protein